MSTRLSFNGAGDEGRRLRRSLVETEAEAEDDEAVVQTFSDLITSKSPSQAKMYSTKAPASSISNKTWRDIDGGLSPQGSEGVEVDSTDYVYEDDAETEPETSPPPTRRPKSRQQFGKSLNSNLRSAAKTLVNKRRKYEVGVEDDDEEHIKQQEPEHLPVTAQTVEVEVEPGTSTFVAVIDDDNQSDNSSSGPAPETTLRSDTDDIVEINTTQRPESALSSSPASPTQTTQPAIENDFQIRAKVMGESLEEKPAADDNNNERDLADNYEVDIKEPAAPYTPPQGINHHIPGDLESCHASGVELRSRFRLKSVFIMPSAR